MMEADTKMLALAFAFSFCCQLPASGGPIPKDDEFQILTAEEITHYLNEKSYSEDCLTSTSSVVKQLGGKAESKEPYGVPTIKGRNCFDCNVTGIHTMRIPECGMFISQIPPLKGRPADEDGTLYDFANIEFKNVGVSCLCRLKNENGQDVSGFIKGVWPNPSIEFVGYKRVWNGQVMHVNNSKVNHKKNGEHVPLNCIGSDEFVKLCNEGQGHGDMDEAIIRGITYYLPLELDEEALKYAKAGENEMAALFKCNVRKDLIGDSAEKRDCRD